jgi:hypothetical protein
MDCAEQNHALTASDQMTTAADLDIFELGC